MNKLKAGFARVNVNPMLGIDVAGYFVPRKADGILDDLEINALALECSGKKVLMLSVDQLGMRQETTNRIRKLVSETTGVDFEAIYLSATHTHTGPEIDFMENHDELVDEYTEFLVHRMADVSALALADLSEAKMGFAVGKAPNVAFIRRFVMKDGSIQTNPGVNNPDIVRPVGDIDESVNVVRFARENADDIVLVNFANHPDVVGGSKISADWPGFLRRTVEKALDDIKCIFFNGAQGDINHVNVHPKGGDLNDMFMDFDDVSRGYGHARHIGRVVAGGVLQVFDKVNYVDVEDIKYINRIIKLPSNMPSPEELPEAIRINDLHIAGRDEELPYTGMMLTTVVAEAGRMVRLANGPETFDMTLSGIAIGPVAFVGIPGEPFSGIGKGIKEAGGFELIVPTCITNGYEGYFPMKDSYDEGGYEARSSNFKAGVAEFIIEEGKSLLKEMEG